MKRSLLLLLFVFLGSSAFSQSKPGDNLEVQGIPDIPERVINTTARYADMRSTGFAGWNRAGGGVYVVTRLKNTAQVYYLPQPMAPLVQVTDFDEPIGGMLVDKRPGKDGFFFLKDIGGSENYQIYYWDRKSAIHTLLTDGKSRYEEPVLSETGAWMAYSSSQRNGKDTDIWMMNPDKPGETKILTEREGSWYAQSFSPDETKLIVSQYISANVSKLYILDIATKAMTPLRDENKPGVSFGEARWGKDGKDVYYTSDEEGEFKSLYEYTVATAEVKPLLKNSKWDVDGFSLSHDRSVMTYVKNEDGISVVHILDLKSMKDETLTTLPVGLMGSGSFNLNDEELAFSIYRPVAPGDVYVLNLKSRKLVRWTNSAPPEMSEKNFVEPKLIRYATFDKVDGKPRTIPAFVYMPKNPKGKVPVIIDIHGGPEGQSLPYFSSTVQYWVNELGFAVVQPNVRGSTGYGKTYLALDNGYNRENSVKDIGALLDWIGKQGKMDANKVAVFGGSYGGYMVLASMATYPQRIACGVDIVGISNFVTFLKNTSDYRRDLRRVEYGDEQDLRMQEFLERISPTNNAYKITSPLFVAQGENDPRVPASEARQIIKSVQKNNVPVWSLFAKDEGHGFSKKNNRDYFMRATILFFEKFLAKR